MFEQQILFNFVLKIFFIFFQIYDTISNITASCFTISLYSLVSKFPECENIQVISFVSVKGKTESVDSLGSGTTLTSRFCRF